MDHWCASLTENWIVIFTPVKHIAQWCLQNRVVTMAGLHSSVFLVMVSGQIEIARVS